MFWTAAIVATVIGKTLARKIKKIGAASLTPNQRIATGIQAIGEIGRKIWMKGLKAWKAREYQPRTSPSGTPSTTASVNPHETRNTDATMYLMSNPFWISSMIPRATLPGVGNKSLPDQRTARPHNVKKIAAIPTGRTIRQSKESASPTRALSPVCGAAPLDVDPCLLVISAAVLFIFTGLPSVRLHSGIVGHE